MKRGHLKMAVGVAWIALGAMLWWRGITAPMPAQLATCHVVLGQRIDQCVALYFDGGVVIWGGP